MIEVYDNFLDKYYIDYITDSVLNLEWTYLKNTTNLNPDGSYQKGCEEEPWIHGLSRTLFFPPAEINFERKGGDIFIPIILKIENTFKLPPRSLTRARLDMTLRAPKNVMHPIHKDFDDMDHYGCILYLNDSDGDTVIYNEKSYQKEYTIQKTITPKKNRLVFFDGDYMHTGHSPCKNNHRILLNTVFFKS